VISRQVWTLFSKKENKTNADQNPIFCLNADLDPGSQTNADPVGSGSCQTLPSTTIEFLLEKYTLSWVIGFKT